MCHSNACLSIYGMGDVSTFVIKGDAPTFVMGDRMGYALAFMINGDALRAMHVSFTCIIRDAQYKHASPFCPRSSESQILT
jgi:hypothetical protein